MYLNEESLCDFFQKKLEINIKLLNNNEKAINALDFSALLRYMKHVTSEIELFDKG